MAFMAFRTAVQEMLQKGFAVGKFSCGVYCFHHYVMQFTMCMGPSMLPTFNAAGDLVLCEHLSKHLGAIQEGDVVVSRSPTNPKQTVCKRIIGLEGAELLVPSADGGRPQFVKVPRGHVWLQGDNLANSTDSRHYGAVPAALVQGRVFAKVYPVGEQGWVPRRDVNEYKAPGLGAGLGV